MVRGVGRAQGALLAGAVVLVVVSFLPWWRDTYASPSWASAWGASTVWIICIVVVAVTAGLRAVMSSVRSGPALAAVAVLAAGWNIAYVVRLHERADPAWWTLGAGAGPTERDTVAVLAIGLVLLAVRDVRRHGAPTEG